MAATEAITQFACKLLPLLMRSAKTDEMLSICTLGMDILFSAVPLKETLLCTSALKADV